MTIADGLTAADLVVQTLPGILPADLTTLDTAGVGLASKLIRPLLKAVELGAFTLDSVSCAGEAVPAGAAPSVVISARLTAPVLAMAADAEAMAVAFRAAATVPAGTAALAACGASLRVRVCISPKVTARGSAAAFAELP